MAPFVALSSDSRLADIGSPGPTLVVEPDPEDLRRTSRALDRAGIEVLQAVSYEEATRVLYASRPRMVLLAADPPADAAWATLERIRDLTDVPVIVLSAAESELAKVRALGAGADDYMTKPVAILELLARIQAIARRLPVDAEQTFYSDGLLEIDTRNVEARVQGKPLRLTALEFRVLLAFVRHANQVLSKSQLLEQAWGDISDSPTDRVKLTVSYLRARFHEAGVQSPIETVRGFGYRYRPSKPNAA